MGMTQSESLNGPSFPQEKRDAVDLPVPFAHGGGGADQQRGQYKTMGHFEGDAIMYGFALIRGVDHESELSEFELDYEGWWKI